MDWNRCFSVKTARYDLRIVKNEWRNRETVLLGNADFDFADLGFRKTF
jgi:hypothetical protein